LRGLLARDDLPRAGHVMKRVLTVLKVLVAQVDILETMTPLEFLGFRDRLEAGSGFQSAQFRELELALGHKRPAAPEQFPPGPAPAARRGRSTCGRRCCGRCSPTCGPSARSSDAPRRPLRPPQRPSRRLRALPRGRAAAADRPLAPGLARLRLRGPAAGLARR